MLFILSFLVIHSTISQNALIELSECTRYNNTILDLLTLKCMQCTNNSVPAKTGLRCVCNPDTVPNDPGCNFCEPGQRISSDRTTCLKCEGSRCNCNETSILYYKNEQGDMLKEPRCIQCTPGTVPSKYKDSCVICTTMECKCSQNSFFCPDPNVRFNPIVNQRKSLYIERRLSWAYTYCVHEDMVGCNELLNLCVLQNYATVNDNACYYYSELANNELRNKLGTITLQTASTIMSLGRPTQVYRFDNSINGRLNYFVAKYSLNGTILYLLPITESKLIICPITSRNLNTAFMFGTKYRLDCQVEFDMIQSHDEYFYELFLQYTVTYENGTSIRQMQPVYVVSELINPGISFNDNNKASWLYSRRFFVLDSVSLKEDNSSQFIRYARSLEFQIFLESSRDGKIAQPIVKIGYGQFSYNGQPIIPLTSTFAVSYNHDPFRHDKDMEITMAVLCSFSVLWAALRAYSWGRRAGKQLADASTIAQFLLNECSALGDVFLLVTTVMTCWLTFAYKSQSYVYYHLLTPSQQTVLFIYVCVATGLKMISYLHMNIRLTLTETFFIDWERQKGLNENSSRTPSSGDAIKGKATHPPVIWRTYLVANEWNELQNYRKTSIGVQVLVMLFLMEHLHWINYAVVQPGFSTESNTSGLQRAMETEWAIVMSVYLGFGFLQWTISVLIVERIILDPFHNFIDLCSISNISVLALAHPFYGYYIHGRSVHGRADTDMYEMNQFLQRERDNLCGLRGLESGSGLQTFSVALPLAFRNQFDQGAISVYMKSLQIKRGANSAPNFARLSGVDAATAKVAATSKIYSTLNTYLQELIDRSIVGVDYIVRDRTIVEGVLDMELDDTSQVGSFIRDQSEVGYSECFLYGNEWAALSFEALLFTLSYSIFTSFAFSSFLTYFLSHCVRALTSSMFTNHLIRSSYVDHRFLI